MFSGQRLKTLRKEKKMSQEKLGSLLNVSKVSVSKWEIGKAFPTDDNLKELARVLGVESDYFTEYQEIISIYSRLTKRNQDKVVNFSSELLEEQGTELPDNVIDIFAYKTYEGLSAGTGYSYYNDGDYTLTYSTEDIPHDFASWVFGDSMEPKYTNGEVVLIKETGFDYDGAIYAVDWDGQTYIKKVYKEKDGLRLVSINNKYKDKFAPYEENPRIIGKIVGNFMPIEN